MRSPWPRVECGVFLILLCSYAFFWHSRDWNTASRLILTYAIVDRGTVCLDGLDRQTRDIASFQGHYFCDKLPGFSLAATVPYVLARLVLGLPPHPRNVPAKDYWPADYWVTLGTSGLFTAFTAVLLVRLARRLGCSPRAALIPALAYGLATPAYAYATLAYGHQLSAFALFGAFWLLWTRGKGREAARLVTAGLLASGAAVVELQVGPVSAILGIYLVIQCLVGSRRPDALAYFGVGAAVPALALLIYNLLAFGSPWDMGYFHHATAQFARVHSRQNPLGLRAPNLDLIGPLLWGEHRGLFFYAPILLLSLPGWIALAIRRRDSLAAYSLAVCAAVFLVNLSYPEWTGGWSTGPRLLVPLLPFAMIPVAALLIDGLPGRRFTVPLAVLLAVAGGVLILLFQGVGARVRQDVEHPFSAVVWPLWLGHPLPRWWTGERFARTLTALLFRSWFDNVSTGWQAVQFLPLVLGQLAGIAGLFVITKAAGQSESSASSSDLGVDQEEQRGGADEDAEDPEAKPQRVDPDQRPRFVP